MKHQPLVREQSLASHRDEITQIQELESVNSTFELQKKNYNLSDPPSYEARIDRLNRIEHLCKNYIWEITEALQNDFGCRSSDWTFTADIFSPLSHVKYVKRNLKKWMKKEKTRSGLLALSGQRTYIVNERLGVVGIMSPFNAPISLAFDPTIEAIAAGNSVMIKISEATPHTARLIKLLVAKYFDADELAVVIGDQQVSKTFASLAWDKFVFTGGSEIGKRILAAAAENLTPVILELGGKSPCVLLDDANITKAAEKITKVRQLNAGQVCIAGDYVLLPENHLEHFIQTALDISKDVYPSIINNKDFTSIIDDSAYNRIVGYIDEAKASGCRIIQSNPMDEAVPDPTTRKIPLTLIVNPADHLMVSQCEIFGPILSIYTYETLESAIAYINSKEKPLALYIFGRNRKQINKIINNTSSGGVTINDLLMHANSKTMGFGGVGYSGMGRYKGGFIGYKAFSNPKTVFEQGLMHRFTDIFFPPYKSNTMRKVLRKQVGVTS